MSYSQFSTLFISGESVLPMSGLHLPPAQPQNAPALPAGEDGDPEPNREVRVLHAHAAC